MHVFPMLLRALVEPPCIRASAATMASPSPWFSLLPWRELCTRKNRSNKCDNASGWATRDPGCTLRSRIAHPICGGPPLSSSPRRRSGRHSRSNSRRPCEPGRPRTMRARRLGRGREPPLRESRLVELEHLLNLAAAVWRSVQRVLAPPCLREREIACRSRWSKDGGPLPGSCSASLVRARISPLRCSRAPAARTPSP